MLGGSYDGHELPADMGQTLGGIMLGLGHAVRQWVYAGRPTHEPLTANI